MVKIKKILLVGLLMSSFISLQAQNYKLNSKIPVDTNVRIGYLQNGIKYYIKKNAKPENRVEMRLVINAGSMMENDNQQGLAHFCEHMCFNGTKNFPKNELVNYLEKTGVKFGAHLNAYTSFDETVYKLQLPSDKSDILNKGYQVLADWSHNVSFDSTEIDKERGVVIEEWRLGLGANERMRSIFFPVLLKNSRYAERLPIGKLEILQNFKYQTVKDFYHDWYRPDLTAVIIVGDIDVNESEKKIKEIFGKIKNIENPRKREIYDIPDNDSPLICVTSDKEATYNAVMLYYKQDKEDVSTLNSYRNSLIYSLYSKMINLRLNELAQKPDAPFLFAACNYGSFLGRSKDAYSSFAVAKENKINESLEILVAENEKIKNFGFTQTELDRQKKALLTSYDKLAKEVDKTQSKNFAREYVSNFLTKEPIPGIIKENDYAKKFIPEISLSEINALAKKWITDKNLAVVVMAKEKEGAKIPTEKDVSDIIKEGQLKKYTAYVDKNIDAPILKKIPKAVSYTNKKINKEFGITELTFKNNVKVILKPTNFNNDQILFTAFALGGSSIVSDENFLNAKYMTQIINQSGFGDFDKITLSKKLSGNTAILSFNSDDLTFGISGSSSSKDFETLMQLNYQYFLNANKNEKVFKTFVSNMENQIKFIAESPEMTFYKKIVKTVSLNNPRAMIFPEIEQLHKMSQDKVFDFYKQAYKNANGYTYIFVGNFDTEKITPLLEKYIGGLPSSDIKRNWVYRNEKFPKGVVEETVYKGTEPKSMVQLAFKDDFDWNRKNYYIAKLLLKTLSVKMRESMREDQGGVYGIRASINLQKYPKSKYSINIGFGCAPENVNKLVETVFTEMKKIATDGPTAVDIEKAQQTFINERETKLKENKFWLNYLKSAYFENNNFQTFEDFKKMISQITIKDLQEAAQEYFTPEHYVKVVLLPENKK